MEEMEEMELLSRSGLGGAPALLYLQWLHVILTPPPLPIMSSLPKSLSIC